MVKVVARVQVNHYSTFKTSFVSCIIPLAKVSHKTKSKISGVGEIYFTSMEMVHSPMLSDTT